MVIVLMSVCTIGLMKLWYVYSVGNDTIEGNMTNLERLWNWQNFSEVQVSVFE